MFVYIYISRSIITLLQVIVHFCTLCRIYTRASEVRLYCTLCLLKYNSLREHQLSVVIHAWCPKAGFGIQHYAATVNLGFRCRIISVICETTPVGPGLSSRVPKNSPPNFNGLGSDEFIPLGARPPQKSYLRFLENILKISG